MVCGLRQSSPGEGYRLILVPGIEKKDLFSQKATMLYLHARFSCLSFPLKPDLEAFQDTSSKSYHGALQDSHILANLSLNPRCLFLNVFK